MKLQAGMAFECEVNGDKVIGRVHREKQEETAFYLRYKDKYGCECEKNISDELNRITNVTNFRIISITLDLLQVGDVIKNEDGKRKVLGRLNDLMFISLPKKYNITTKGTYHIDELKRECFEIIQPEWEEKPKGEGI